MYQRPESTGPGGLVSSIVPNLDRDFCVACRERKPGTETRKVSRSYVPSLAYGAMILAPILGLLLIALMRVEHKIELPFCEGCWTRKRIVSVVEILSFLALVASPFAGFVMMLNFDSGYAFFAALGPAAAAVIAVQIYKFTVMPRFRKTDKDQVIVDAAPYGDLVFTKATVATLRTS